MRKDRISAVIGVLLVFVIGALFIVFCKISDANAPRQSMSDYEDDYDEEYDEDEEYSGVVPKLEQRGYVADRKLPEQFQKLIDTNLFAVTEEKIKKEEEEMFEGYESEEDYAEDYFDEDEEYDPEELAELIKEDKEELKDELQEEYKDTLKYIKKFGSPDFLKKNNSMFVTLADDEDVEDLYCLLKWDKKTGQFLDKDKIAAIENCGFPGFSEMVSEVERGNQNRRKAMEETINMFKDEYLGDYDEDDEGEYNCTMYCQGVEFQLYNDSSEYYTLSVSLNYSDCYTPQQYRGVIDGVTSDGSYFLYSSYVVGGKDILVFSRNHAIDFGSDQEAAEMSNKWASKRIALIFNNGTLEDYYLTSNLPRLDLDDADRKILDTYVSGLGKTLSGVPETAEGKIKYMFRAE